MKDALLEAESPVLTTSRLFLRELSMHDYDALYRVLADSDIMRHYRKSCG